MAGRSKKSTKKFEKNHLKDTIDRRKEFAKVKQRHQLKEKRKARNTSHQDGDGDGDGDEVNGEGDAAKSKENGAKDAFAEMNVDDFFGGGFDIDALKDETSSKKKKKKDVKPKIGKRKRTEDAGEGSGEESGSGSGGEAEGSGEEPASSDADDFEAHQGQLEALKEKDPEFYKYLEANDAELLDFGEHGDLAGVAELSEEEEKETEEPAKKKKKRAQEKEDGEEEDAMVEEDEVTMAMVNKWQKSMQAQHSLRAMRQAVLAFRSAAYVNEEAEDRKYTISDPEVYHRVLVTALEYVPKVLNHHLPTKEAASGKIRLSTESKKFKTLTPLIKSYTSSIHQLLTNLSDAPTLKLTLSAIEPMLPYLLQFRKLLKVLIRTIVGIWSDYSNTEATRITAFLIVRRLAVIGDPGIRETVLKSTYEGVIKGSRNTSVHTMAGVNLTKNSAAEIWGIDQNVAYTTGFTFIRQLAIHLRGSITNPSKDSYKTVYNWQYVHSLDFWSRVLSSHCDALVEAKAGKPSALRPLIYPVVQITIGAMRLIPTAQYFPLRFQLMRSLLRMSLSTGTYIPLAPALVEVLNSAEMRKPPKSSTLKALDFATCIRAPKSYLRTRVYQDGVGEQVAELLSEFLVLWTKNIAFPELSLPIVVMLKRWIKEVSSKSSGNKNTKISQMIGLLVQKIESNSRWIEEKRLEVTYAPKDRAEVEGFLKEVEWETTPLGAFVKGQRKLRTEKAKLVEEGRREEEKRRNEGSDEEMGVDDDGEDVDEDEEPDE